MTIELHLGVLDVPYTHDDSPALNKGQARNKRRNAARAAFGAPEFHGTTGDVAQILEDEYHVMELFYEEVGGDQIARAFEQSAKEALEDLIAGAPRESLSLTRQATEEIETAFRIFIDQKELDGIVPGVPTAAALAGVNHRLKHPYAKGNPERPSFKDTGLYQASFKAWAEE